MKHIESILPENIADELTRFLSDDATISSALKDLLHRDTGCDIPSLDSVPTSDIEEIIPLCLSILRRFWNTPLTALEDGTEKQSIAEVFQKVLGDRVQGNEVWGIPAIHGDIPTAVSALLHRHIDDGLNLTLADDTTMPLPDGISLAQVLGSTIANNITEITDTNVGWEYKNPLQNILAIFPNMTKLTLGMGEISDMYISSRTTPEITEFNAPHLKRALRCCLDRGMSLQELYLPSLEVYQGGNSVTNGFLGMVNSDQTIKKINVPNMREFYFGRLAESCPELTEVVTGIEKYDERGGYLHMLPTCPKVEKIVFGTIKEWYMAEPNNRSGICNSVHLVHMEFGQGTCASINLRSWSPTTALAERLDEFLYNFQNYITDRVADMTGKVTLTLTLSSAVYAALEAQEGQTILATLANKNWNVAQA